MEPIVERIKNPEGQSFYAARFDVRRRCNSSYWHIHAEYELVFIKNGQGTIQVGSHFSSYTDGILIFLGPHIPHLPFTNYDNPDNIEVVIQFKQSLLEDHLSKLPEFRKINEVCQHSQTGLLFGPQVKFRLSDQLMGLVDLPKPLQFCKFLEILLELAETKDRTDMNLIGMKPGSKSDDYDRVNKVYNFVSANYKNEIRIADAAELVGLTTNSFCRFFKKLNQKSFIQFVNDYRINKAIEMINLKRGSISEMMYESGFNDPSYFNRQFKKSKGISPSDYKRKLMTV